MIAKPAPGLSHKSSKNNWALFGVILACGSFIASCGMQDNGAVTTDLVHIAATASKPHGIHAAQSFPVITFEDTLIHLGIIAEGHAEEISYAFVNTGESALVLADVSTSCGCTVANDWPKTAIAPGQGAEINVRFDSQGRTGENRKEIFVVSNTTPSTTTLVLTADVIGPKR